MLPAERKRDGAQPQKMMTATRSFRFCRLTTLPASSDSSSVLVQGRQFETEERRGCSLSQLDTVTVNQID
jgi:hypothetical protein